MKTIVLLPTYNEKDNLEAMVESIIAQQLGLDILVIDDNSPDGTGKIADTLKEKYACVDVLHRQGKEGLGKAYIAGFTIAIERKYEAVVTMDCDFSHDPHYLPKLIQTAQNYDLVLGSRYVVGGGVEGWGWIRKFISRGGSIYSRIILGLTCKDLTGGFKCYKTNVLKKIGLENINSQGYSFQIETTYRIYRLGARIKEIPIVFVDRRAGHSKMSFAIAWEAVFMVPKLKFGRPNNLA